ncbi:GTPase [Catellatospora sp. NPDC049111]|uniref:GTPase n=1 Tax=Catellatospora sp. NPDC049111 TaxID=3155271 RepID=UPI0033C24D40
MRHRTGHSRKAAPMTTWHDWAEKIDEQIWHIEGEPHVQQLRDLWHAFNTDPRTKITMWGVFNSGKSSLIRRLLAEDGTPVPESVRAGADRTQYETHVVASGDVDYIDTPGLDSGAPEHDRRADAAAALTDVLVVVTTPLLRQAEVRRITRMLTRSGHRYPDGSLHIVVNQLDEAGVDPRSDLAAYQELKETKRQTVVNALRAAGISEALPPVHTVCADAWRINSRRASPVAANYDASRSFDSITEFVAALHAGIHHRTPLRHASAVRHWTRAAQDAIDSAESQLAAQRELLESADDARRRIGVWREKLTAVAAACEARLRTIVHRELRAVMLAAERPSSDSDGARLQTALTTWHTQSLHELAQLASQFDADTDFGSAGRGSVSDSLAGTLDSVRSLGAAPRADLSSPMSSPTITRLVTLSDAAGPALRKSFESSFGFTVDRAASLIAGYDEAVGHIATDQRSGVFAILNRASTSGMPQFDRERLMSIPGTGPLMAYLERNPELGDPDNAAKIARRLKLTNRAAAAAPIVVGGIVEVARIMSENAHAQRTVQANAERDRMLAQLVDDVVAAETGAAGSTSPWITALNQVRAALDTHTASDDDRKKTAARIQVLLAAAEALSRLLAQPPR